MYKKCIPLTTALIGAVLLLLNFGKSNVMATDKHDVNNKLVSDKQENYVLGTPKIWDKAPHNAFTGLIRHQNRWWCVFREGSAHISQDGTIRVITSTDSISWESAASLKSNVEDLRDPKLTITPDGRFMLSAIGLHNKTKKYQSYVWFSNNGRDWTQAVAVADPNYWLWRVTWHKGFCYGVGYESGPVGSVRLYRSQDGKKFETIVPNLYDKGRPNESSIVFLSDDTAICLLRRDPGNALLGIAKPPYTEWTWKDTGTRVGGPQMLVLPDGRIIAAVRLSDGVNRTSICWVDPQSGRLSEFIKLPSGGDNSYAGLVWYDDLLWVSYHSSYYGKVSIYLAKVKIPLSR